MPNAPQRAQDQPTGEGAIPGLEPRQGKAGLADLLTKSGQQPNGQAQDELDDEDAKQGSQRRFFSGDSPNFVPGEHAAAQQHGCQVEGFSNFTFRLSCFRTKW